MKLMLMSDSPSMNTGYGQTAMYMLNELDMLGWEVASIGFGHAGAPVRFEGLEIWPGASQFMLAKSLAKFKPDILLHMRDNWVFIPRYNQSPYSLIKMAHDVKAHMVNFTPVQATPLPPEFVESINTQADFTYITNQTGVDSIIKQGEEMKMDLKNKVGLMYNGIDFGKFRTLKVQRNTSNMPKDKKMVTFVGANMDYRKQIPVSMLAFRKYLSPGWTIENPTEQVRDDAFLYLHTNPFGGFDIPLFINLLKLEKHVFLKSSEGIKLATWDLTPQEMAVMFNLSDAYLTCTSAEGFNQPLLEAIACGLPAAVTDTPIHRELFTQFGDRVQFIKSHASLPTVWAFEHNCDPDDGAEKLAKALDIGKKEMNMNEFPQFSYRRIMKKFAEEAERLVEIPFPDPEEEKKKLAEVEKKAAEAMAAVRSQA